MDKHLFHSRYFCLFSSMTRWMRLIFQRRAHDQYHNLDSGLSLGNREYNSRSTGLIFLISLDSRRPLKIVLGADWVRKFLHHSDWFFVTLLCRWCSRIWLAIRFKIYTTGYTQVFLTRILVYISYIWTLSPYIRPFR